VPAESDLDTTGLEIAPEALAALLDVDDDALREQLPQVEAHLDTFGERLPDELRAQLAALHQRLEA
jgi:phosphoenolpyruvate carboxykinase (GTP)